MILLDTHIWIWWVQDTNKLTHSQNAQLQEEEQTGELGVSAISLWEVAKLVELGKLSLPLTVENWLPQALAYPSIKLLPLTVEIAVGSTKLPGNFHRDPADQIIVATARILDCPLMTVDQRIVDYQHVQLAK